MDFNWKKEKFPLWSMEPLPQMEEVIYLGVSFMIDSRMEPEIDQQTGALSSVIRMLFWSVMVKKDKVAVFEYLSLLY